MRVRKCGCIRLFRGAVEELQCLLPREMVPITLHTPPSFSCCFSDRCRPSQLRCTQKRGFLPFLTPVSIAAFPHDRLFFFEIQPISPGAAQMRSEPGACFARSPSIQAHGSALEAPGARLLCTAASASVTVYCRMSAGSAVCCQIPS